MLLGVEIVPFGLLMLRIIKINMGSALIHRYQNINEGKMSNNHIRKQYTYTYSNVTASRIVNDPTDSLIEVFGTNMDINVYCVVWSVFTTSDVSKFVDVNPNMGRLVLYTDSNPQSSKYYLDSVTMYISNHSPVSAKYKSLEFYYSLGDKKYAYSNNGTTYFEKFYLVIEPSFHAYNVTGDIDISIELLGYRS